LLAVLGAAPVDADDESVIVDGISVLSGSRTSNESDAVPLLLSDIEFESTLILASRMGPAGIGQRPTADDWARARRRATLIRLLAGQARHLHEVADSLIKRQLLHQVAYDLGGEEALERLLTRIGMKRQALDSWIENAALALTQIQYTKDQVERPSRREVEARAIAEVGGSADWGLVREKYRLLILKEKTDAQIERWLKEVEGRGHLRIIR
jgi:hypothetical protein